MSEPGARRFAWEVPTGPVRGLWFDGQEGRPIPVRLDPEGTQIRLFRPDGLVIRLDGNRLRRPADQAGPGAVTYVLDGEAGRLVTDDPRGIAMIEALAPSAAKPPARPPLAGRALQVGAMGAAVLAVLIFGILPGLARLLAGAMGAEAEVALGEIHFEQSRAYFAGLSGKPLRICDDPVGQAALDAMVARVAADVDLPYPLQVVVLDDGRAPVLNAYAVAGGRITFLNGMIQAADRPEEIAAVLAHELGHVANRDAVAGLLEGASATAIMALLAGDVTGGGLIGGAAGQALTSSYSRRAELRADEYARDRLLAAGLPPSAMGTLFDRLRARQGDVDGVLEHFSSHPALADRIAAAQAVGDPPIGAPALTPKAWTALRGICD